MDSRLLDDILEFLSTDGQPHRFVEIASATNTSEWEMRQGLELLVKMGLVRLDGSMAVIDSQVRELILD